VVVGIACICIPGVAQSEGLPRVALAQGRFPISQTSALTHHRGHGSTPFAAAEERGCAARQHAKSSRSASGVVGVVPRRCRVGGEEKLRAAGAQVLVVWERARSAKNGAFPFSGIVTAAAQAAIHSFLTRNFSIVKRHKTTVRRGCSYRRRDHYMQLNCRPPSAFYAACGFLFAATTDHRGAPSLMSWPEATNGSSIRAPGQHTFPPRPFAADILRKPLCAALICPRNLLVPKLP
jgi:hypothetical protein